MVSFLVMDHISGVIRDKCCDSTTSARSNQPIQGQVLTIFLVACTGACRDASGFQGRHLAANRQNFSVCKAKCDLLGVRCDAFDLDGVAPPTGTNPEPRYPWCAIWGSTLTATDAPAGSVWTYACNGDCPQHNETRVCRGDTAVGAANTCFPRPPAC